MTDIKVELWELARFENAQYEWTNLLERSNSDKLFMSWEWLYTWWDTFSNKNKMTLQVMAAYDTEHMLVGLAPLFLTSSISKKVIQTQRLQFMGNCWRNPGTMRTELLDFIVDKQYSEQVIQALFQYINVRSNWDEFILSDLSKSSATYNILIKGRSLNQAYYRTAEEFESYYLPVENSFDTFCKSLGKNTRLKLLNRRKILGTMGEVEYVVLQNDQIESHFELLNTLHTKRWGEPAFDGDWLIFNLGVAKLLAKKGQLQFSIIMLDKIPVSIQYNYLIDNHEYNIQAGFDANLNSKISLGYLHFGYAIESAFNNNVKIYDFLAGEGKNTQYKERLTSHSQLIVSMQIIRNKKAIVLYKIYDLYSEAKHWLLKFLK